MQKKWDCQKCPFDAKPCEPTDAQVDALKGMVRARKVIRCQRDRGLNAITRDPLTDLDGYSLMLERLDGLLSHEPRKGDSVAGPDGDRVLSALLLVWDGDHFKEKNDKYGHEFGDEVVKVLANMVRGNTRETDLRARRARAGDEFIAVLPGLSLEDAVKKTRKVQNKFKLGELIEPVPGEEPVRVTASVAGGYMPEILFREQVLVGIDAVDQVLSEFKRGPRLFLPQMVEIDV